jgi:hypothetical protein
MKFKRASVSICSGGLILLLGIPTAQVRGTQRESNDGNLAPRTLEILDVGYKLPIEIVVRNLRKKEHWLRDLELEIKNVSTKPIYGVYFLLLLLDDKGPSGVPVGFSLEYGRSELLHPSLHASAGDKPFGSGETVIIRAEKRVWEGYEMRLANKNVPEQASYNLRMIVTAITFGDGTGFINGGVPYPDRPPTRLRPYQYVRVPIDSK